METVANDIFDGGNDIIATRIQPAYDARGDGKCGVFMASDKASGMIGTTVNLTLGSLDD